MPKIIISPPWKDRFVHRAPVQHLLPIVVAVAIASVALVSPNQAFAYSWMHCLDRNIKWSSNTITTGANPVSFPPGSIWYRSLLDGVDGINLNRSNFRLQLASDVGGVGTGNGRNEVWFTGDQSLLKGAPAVARTYYECYWKYFGLGPRVVRIIEVDVFFDDSWNWTPSGNKSLLTTYSGRGQLLSGTAAHELGHLVGLRHENRLYNIMGADYSHLHVNGSMARTYAGVDAGEGAAFLYGTRSDGWEDIGVVHWKYAGSSGEYSRHAKTRIYDSTGGDLRTTAVNGEVGYLVKAGDVVQPQFTYENSGKNAQSFQFGIYISSNDLITTRDRRIAGFRGRLDRDSIVTTTVNVTIPGDLVADENYWLGVIVDDDNSIDERMEWNNASYLPVKVYQTVPRDDHGNELHSATIIEAPSSTSGVLETGGDVDVFRFDLARTSKLVVQTSGSTDTFGTLHLQGRVVDDDDSGTDTNFLIGAPAVRPGTYYVKVKGTSTTTTGSYTLDIAAEDVHLHELPFLPSAPRHADGALDRGRPHHGGIVTISNLSEAAGEFVLEGFDGDGMPGLALQPVQLEPYETRFLTVFDLEAGDDRRGILPGLGDGSGDWRLRVVSALPLDVRAYTGAWGRGVTPLAEDTTVPRATDDFEEYFYYVPWLNPGSNFNNRSFLVVVNAGESAARIGVRGHDAAGQPSPGEASFTVAPRQIRRVYSDWLENIDGRAPAFVDGGLGDGSGQWRLTVTSDVPVYVLGLAIAREDGIISNLSR